MAYAIEEKLHSHQIYLVRHGDVDLSPDICYGQLDCNVTLSFENDLQKLTRYFERQLKIESGHDATVVSPIIISSPLTRCHQLAKGLTEHLNQKAHVFATLQSNECLKEISFGEWEGNSWDTIGHDNIEEWNNNFFDYTFPEGESARAFFKRVVAAWNSLLSELAVKNEDQTIIIVSHAGVIRSILTCFLEMPLSHALTLTIDKMSVSCLTITPHQPALSRCLGINYSL